MAQFMFATAQTISREGGSARPPTADHQNGLCQPGIGPGSFRRCSEEVHKIQHYSAGKRRKKRWKGPNSA
eukprot:3607295-Alexandrium_andersonii.AAC.1